MTHLKPNLTRARAPRTAPADDPFRYGWRFVPRPTPDDPHHLEQVPLTLEDVLHPEVGDVIVHSATVTKPTGCISPVCCGSAWSRRG